MYYTYFYIQFILFYLRKTPNSIRVLNIWYVNSMYILCAPSEAFLYIFYMHLIHFISHAFYLLNFTWILYTLFHMHFIYLISHAFYTLYLTCILFTFTLEQEWRQRGAAFAQPSDPADNRVRRWNHCGNAGSDLRHQTQYQTRGKNFLRKTSQEAVQLKKKLRKKKAK